MVQLWDRPDWFDHAKCRGANNAKFFPEHGSNAKAARELCAQCPVTKECLDYAMRHSDTRHHGVWGGTSERERRRLLRIRAA